MNQLDTNQRPDNVRWLHEQLPVWVTKGLVSPAQADAIRQLYPKPKAGLPWGMIIFSGLGAVVIGLGVILLLAYNWQAIPKFGKLGLVFGALVTAHAAGLWLFQRADWRKQLGEALSLLGTVLFGAGIWLVAQVYHIDEHYPNGFLLWAAGAVALAWTMSSAAQGAVAALTLTIWGCTEDFGFRTPVHWAPLLLLIAVGGLAWKERSRWLLVVVLVGFYFLLLSNAACCRGQLAFPTALNLSVFFVALGLLLRDNWRFPGVAAVLNFFGWTGFLVVMFILSFTDATSDILRWHGQMLAEKQWCVLAAYGWLPFGLALAAWGWVLLNRARIAGAAFAAASELWLLPLAALFCQVIAAFAPSERPANTDETELLLVAAVNLIFLAIAAMWMARGCRVGNLKRVILGSLMLAALVFARYFDFFESLAARGLVFLILGAMLFVEGFFYRRSRQHAADKEGGSEA